MSTSSRNNTAGLILAGGQGSRLGGLDKGLVKYQGRYLVESVLDRFAPQVCAVTISINRNHEIYRALGYPLVEDHQESPVESFQGPLFGICAGLEYCDQPWLACVPCDTPDLPLTLVQRLRDGAGDCPAAYVDAGRGQYLCCVLATTLKPVLQDYLQGGGRSVHRWFAEIDAAPVDFSDCIEAFANLNSPEDFPGFVKHQK
jgi:molybdopterin-guanine dinucleotide biosynthesis protein A